VGVSVRTLSERFRKAIGRSPKAEMLRVRMEHAKSLLRGHRRPIADIALACGASSASQFARDFHRIVGRTPGAWRQEESRKADN
jgi:transcriptional regulator GlxA family with amidase domain